MPDQKSEQSGASTGTVLIALGVNAVVAVAKGVGGVVSGSSAMLAEAAHSVADTLNEVFLLVALRRGERAADQQHPFGYGKERFFWSLIAAVGIFVAGAMFSFFEAYRTVTGPPGEEGGFLVPYVVLALAFLLEGASFLRAIRQVRREARAAGKGLLAHIRASDDPTVKTVASEDSAALVGIVIAAAGILGNQLTGDVLYQGIASLLIGLLLVYVAYALGRDSMGLLISESADPALRQQLTDELSSYDEVDQVIDLLTMRIGTRRLLVAVRLDFDTSLSSDRIEQLSTRIDERLHNRFPAVDQLFLDATAHTESRPRERREARERLDT